MDELAKAYETLGVNARISTPELQKHYRELVKRWHPDQFSHDAEEKRVADETLRDINAAYQRIMQARKVAEEQAAFEGKPTPEPEPHSEPEPAYEAASTGSSGYKVWGLALALIVVIAAAGIAWQQKWLGNDASPAPEASATPIAAPKPPEPPGPVIAHKICLATECFVAEIWHNGKLVPDSQRKTVADRFGACTEEVNLTLREGDWLVFNPVKNRFRWNDALFFGVAGMTTNKAVSFVSSAKDGRWTSMDNLEQVSQFIKERDFQGKPVQLIPQNRMWSEGPGFMNFVMSTNWTGEPIWGQGPARNTYIKFVAKPVPPVQVTAR